MEAVQFGYCTDTCKNKVKVKKELSMKDGLMLVYFSSYCFSLLYWLTSLSTGTWTYVHGKLVIFRKNKNRAML